MSENSINMQTPSLLEMLNKQRAGEQAKEINRSLTRLKKISHPPKAKDLDTDKTGKFIVVPINNIQAETIESAYTEAEKTCTDSGLELEKSKKKKKWFKWG